MKNTKKSITYSLVLAVYMVLSFCPDLQAKNLEMNFFDWTLFKTNRGDRFVCYLVSTPIKQTGYDERKGEAYFMVTSLVNDADEVTASSGYVYKPTADIEISFGPRKFYLFPHYGVAWAFDINDDLDIIKEMQKNPEMTIIGTTIDNKMTYDTYSLIGFSKAYLKLKEMCKND